MSDLKYKHFHNVYVRIQLKIVLPSIQSCAVTEKAVSHEMLYCNTKFSVKYSRQNNDTDHHDQLSVSVCAK